MKKSILFALCALLAFSTATAQLERVSIWEAPTDTATDLKARFFGVVGKNVKGVPTMYKRSLWQFASMISARVVTVDTMPLSVRMNALTGLVSGKAAVNHVHDYNSLANLPVIPTNNNQLSNGNNYITAAALAAYLKTVDTLHLSDRISAAFSLASGKANLVHSHEYSSLLNLPVIPTNTNQLTNGSNYITAAALAAYLKAVDTLPLSGRINALSTAMSGKANLVHSHEYSSLLNLPVIPTNTNQLTNGNNFITAADLAAYLKAVDTLRLSDRINLKANLVHSHEYSSLLNLPVIPTNNNQLSNGNNYISKATADLLYASAVTAPTISKDSLVLVIAALRASLDSVRSKVIFKQNASITATASTLAGAKADFVGAGIGSRTIPANTMTAGKMYRIRISGVYSTPLLNLASITCRLEINGTAITTAVATTLLVSANNQAFEAQQLIQIRTTGAAGSLVAIGSLNFATASNGRAFVDMNTGAGTVAVNTTVANTITPTVQFSNSISGNSLTSVVMTLESVD